MSKGIDELRDWAMHNVRLISILPSNKNLQVDTKLTDVLEEDVDEKHYLSEEQTNKLLSDYQFSDTHQGGIMTTRHKITKETDISHSLMARDYKGIGNQEMTAVKTIQPVLTPDRIKKRQNGRRFKEDGEPMFTLTSQDRHGVLLGGELNAEKIERDTFEILQKLQEEVGEKEVAKWRSRILDTFQQEKVLRQDVYEERLDIEQDKEKFKRKKQSVKRKNEDRTFDGQKVLREMPINKEFRCSSHGREPLQQFAGEFTSVMQKLSYETSQKKNLYHLRETTQGIRLLRKALSEIQEIWEPLLHKKQSIRIRKLVPIEVWRLQGFTDEQFYKAKNDGVSNSQLYKQAGNSVTVNVIDAIARRLL